MRGKEVTVIECAIGGLPKCAKFIRIGDTFLGCWLLLSCAQIQPLRTLLKLLRLLYTIAQIPPLRLLYMIFQIQALRILIKIAQIAFYDCSDSTLVI